MIGPKEIGQEAEVRNLEEMNRGQELQLTLSRPRAERRAGSPEPEGLDRRGV